MTIQHQIEIAAPADVVFSLYEDVGSWATWDSETSAVHLPGGLRAGSAGWLKPREGPKASIRVSEVVPRRSFTVEARLPLCRMRFGHELSEASGRTIATHWVRFSGPLAFLFRRLIGKGIDATLPATLLGFKRASEERHLNR